MPERWVVFIWKFAIIVDSIAEHVHINLLEVRLKLMYCGEVIDGKQKCVEVARVILREFVRILGKERVMFNHFY